MKRNYGRSLKGQLQKGFTLVELAIVLVIAGIILVAVLKGTDAINKAKVERMVADIKGLQASILEFQKRTGRLPGDCNNDGVIGYSQITTAATTQLTTLDFTEANRILPPAAVGGGVSNATCIDTVTTADENNPNLMWNELRRAGVVDQNRLNRELGRHQMGDVFLVSGIADANSATFTNQIVVFGIPLWLAEAIDAEFDGQAQNYGDNLATGPANIGRARSWIHTDGAGAAAVNTAVTAGSAGGALANLPTYNNTAGYGQYNNSVGDRDALVVVSYQFETRKLPN